MEPLAMKSKILSGFSVFFLYTVGFISYYRIAYRCEMHTNLMSTTRKKIYFQERVFVMKISSIAKFCFSDFWI
jgi:hypothetical protein